MVTEPLYSVLPNGMVSDGTDDAEPSFFQEYKYKLENLYSHFYTKKGAQMAEERQHAAMTFYNDMLHEVTETYAEGWDQLKRQIEK